jgi:hypothetical protein
MRANTPLSILARLRREVLLSEPCLEWLQPPAGAANLAGERRAIEFHGLAKQRFARSIERQVIVVLVMRTCANKAELARLWQSDALAA